MLHYQVIDTASNQTLLQTCHDDSFGPVVHGCRDDFDFTLTFENTVLSILPSVIALAISAPRIYVLWSRPRSVIGRQYQLTKLVALILFGLLQLTLLVLWSASPQFRSKASVSAAALSLVDAPVFCMLSFLEHSKASRPSAILILYMLLSTLFDIVKVRTVWLIAPGSAIFIVLLASTIAKVIIVLLESYEKARFLVRTGFRRSPETTSGIINQSVYFWLNKLLIGGASGTLSPADLYELDDPLRADSIANCFVSAWNQAKPQGHHSTYALFQTFKWSILAPILPRLVMVGFTIVQPLLLTSLLQYLEDTTVVESSNYGRGLIAAYAFDYLGIALSTALFAYSHHRALSMIRSALIVAMSWQTSKIDVSAVREPKSVVSLMSTDIDMITLGLQSIHEIWAGVLQACICTWLLARRTGPACVIPLLIAILCALGTSLVGRTMRKRQSAWMEKVEQRITTISGIVTSIRGVKMRGMESALVKLVQYLRLGEIQLAKRFRQAQMIVVIFAFGPSFIASAATFTFFIVQGRADNRQLDVNFLFTTYSLISLLTEPLQMAYQSVPSVLAASASLQRIHIFLAAEEQKDSRTISRGHPARTPGSLETAEQDIELVPIQTKTMPTRSRLTTRPNAMSSTFETEAASIRWGNGGNVLKEIQFKVPKGSLCFVIGPVASGKTTLCESLLGQTVLSYGTIVLNDSKSGIAYCSQSPWLFDASIHDNILGFSQPSASWYNEVVEAVDLLKDLAERPMGQKAKVGSLGSNLSGGQRKKVAIARAVYSRKETLIFDDSFAGVDPLSEQHIFSRVFGPTGILKHQGCTVVFAASSLRYLSYADHIVALGGDGKKIFEGSFAQLKILPDFADAIRSAEQVSKSSFESQGLCGRLGASTIHEPEPVRPDIDAAIAVTKRFSDFQVYTYYFGAVSLSTSLSYVVYVAIGAVLRTMPTVWLKLWSSASEHDTKLGTPFYLGFFWFYQCLGLLFLYIAGTQIYQRVVPGTGQNLHQRLLNTMINAPLAVFSSTDAGTIINRFAQDMQLIDGALPKAFMNFTIDLAFAVGQFLLIVISSPWTGLAFPPMIAVCYVLQKFYLRTSKQLRFMELEAKAPLYTHFLETISGLSTIRTYGWMSQTLERSHELLDQSQRPFYLLTMIQQWLTLVLNVIITIVAILVVTLAVQLRYSSAAVAVALIQIMTLGDNLRWIITAWTEVETSIGAVSRIKSFCADTACEHRECETEAVPSDWPTKGEIEWKGVVASYGSRPTEPVIRELSLSVEPGQKIALCGSSGSGKTSLIISLFRLIEYQQGSITIDGIDISRIPRYILRERLNGVPQDPFFLPGTIRFNLDPVGCINNDTLIEVLERVRLWDNCISTRGGLAADIADCNFSHGQRQLFCLAVALLRPGNIVILDEFTSSVDHGTDTHMQQIVRDAFKDRTVIAIAHRLDTILDFDKVAVLDHGRLVEFDTPTRLLARTSRFQALYLGEKSKQ